MSQQIEHTGIITRIDNKNIRVQIVQQSACSSCHAKGACSAADMDEKFVDVESTDSSLKIGDQVVIFGQNSMGLLAVLLAFVIPFLLILLTLFVLRNLVASDSVAGLIALGTLVPYYIILSFFNKQLKSKLRFQLKRSGDV
jgi:sigma-E factor negative regulatory protein RseC